MLSTLHSLVFYYWCTIFGSTQRASKTVECLPRAIREIDSLRAAMALLERQCHLRLARQSPEILEVELEEPLDPRSYRDSHCCMKGSKFRRGRCHMNILYSDLRKYLSTLNLRQMIQRSKCFRFHCTVNPLYRWGYPYWRKMVGILIATDSVDLPLFQFCKPYKP